MIFIKKQHLTLRFEFYRSVNIVFFYGKKHVFWLWLFNKTYDEIQINNKLEIIDNNYKLDYRLLTLLHKLKITKNIKTLFSYIDENIYIDKELKIKI